VADLAALAAVVRGFSNVTVEQPTAELVTEGERVYRTHCTECHGGSGAGDGFAAKELPVPPTDFRGRRASVAENLRVLATGVEGTSMAPWTERLTADELLAVAHYVRSFYAGEGQ
jgi:cytochrome c oxidase cbb3-type subunit II